MENNIQTKSPRIWSLKTVTILTILFIPIAGAFLAGINHKIMGSVKRGIFVIIGTIALVIGLNFIIYFITLNQSISDLLSVLIASFLIFLDQQKLYARWKQTYPNE